MALEENLECGKESLPKKTIESVSMLICTYLGPPPTPSPLYCECLRLCFYATYSFFWGGVVWYAVKNIL